MSSRKTLNFISTLTARFLHSLATDLNSIATEGGKSAVDISLMSALEVDNRSYSILSCFYSLSLYVIENAVSLFKKTTTLASSRTSQRMRFFFSVMSNNHDERLKMVNLDFHARCLISMSDCNQNHIHKWQNKQQNFRFLVTIFLFPTYKKSPTLWVPICAPSEYKHC